MKKKLFCKPADVIFVVLSLAAITFSFFQLKNNGNSEARLIITSPDREFVYPMNENTELQIEGEIGISIIKIQDNRAFFVDSPCPNHVCTDTPALRFNNDWAACMPNGIFIRIEGGSDFDSEAYINELGEVK